MSDKTETSASSFQLHRSFSSKEPERSRPRSSAETPGSSDEARGDDDSTRRVWLPWSDSCFVCGDANPKGLGVRFTATAEEVVVETEIDPAFEGFPGHAHGGVIAALLDEAAGWACSTQEGSLLLTAELKVSYRRPVPGGAQITVRGWVSGRKGKAWVGASRIEDQQGTVLATAEGLFVAVPDRLQSQAVSKLKMPGRSARSSDISPFGSAGRSASPSGRGSR